MLSDIFRCLSLDHRQLNVVFSSHHYHRRLFWSAFVLRLIEKKNQRQSLAGVESTSAGNIEDNLKLNYIQLLDDFQRCCRCSLAVLIFSLLRLKRKVFLRNHHSISHIYSPTEKRAEIILISFQLLCLSSFATETSSTTAAVGGGGGEKWNTNQKVKIEDIFCFPFLSLSLPTSKGAGNEERRKKLMGEIYPHLTLFAISLYIECPCLSSFEKSCRSLYFYFDIFTLIPARFSPFSLSLFRRAPVRRRQFNLHFTVLKQFN